MSVDIDNVVKSLNKSVLVQGMSDLLSPLLAEVKNESDAYWCFVGLMQKTIFVSTPRDADMDRQLVSDVC